MTYTRSKYVCVSFLLHSSGTTRLARWARLWTTSLGQWRRRRQTWWPRTRLRTPLKRRRRARRPVIGRAARPSRRRRRRPPTSCPAKTPRSWHRSSPVTTTWACARCRRCCATNRRRRWRCTARRTGTCSTGTRPSSCPVTTGQPAGMTRRRRIRRAGCSRGCSTGTRTASRKERPPQQTTCGGGRRKNDKCRHRVHLPIAIYLYTDIIAVTGQRFVDNIRFFFFVVFLNYNMDIVYDPRPTATCCFDQPREFDISAHRSAETRWNARDPITL